MPDHDKRVALVTGANRGIGYAISRPHSDDFRCCKCDMDGYNIDNKNRRLRF
jgi:hypothetical protein